MAEYVLENNILKVTVDSKGCEIRDVLCKTDNTHRMWNANPEGWKRVAPVLFPLIGKYKDNQSIYNGKVYEMGQHGFARDMEFTLVKHNDGMLVMRLESDENTKEKYPFDFALELEYHLIDNEIKEVFKLQIQEWFRNKIFSNTEQLQDFWKAFKDGNTQIMEMYLNKVLSNSVSVFDTKARNDEKESSYHNLLIGILSGNEDWLVKSNVEAGEGFADIIVETDDPDEGIIAELKYTKDFKAMEKSCEKALKQIKDRRYQEYLLNDDRQNIMYYGITFCRKRCKVLVER